MSTVPDRCSGWSAFAAPKTRVDATSRQAARRRLMLTIVLRLERGGERDGDDVALKGVLRVDVVFPLHREAQRLRADLGAVADGRADADALRLVGTEQRAGAAIRATLLDHNADDARFPVEAFAEPDAGAPVEMQQVARLVMRRV